MDQALRLNGDFVAALRARLQAFAGLIVEEVRTRTWRSANFQGARHELALRLEGTSAADDADALLLTLAGEPLEVAGQIVADLTLAADQREPERVRVTLEALTVCG
jgi:hypothetical protein